MKKPRETVKFHGNHEAVETLKKIFSSGKIPHAILISGPKGLGKSTLAYHITNFILSGNLDSGIHDFSIDEKAPVFNKISSKSHPDLMIVEIDGEDKKEEISVDKIRDVNSFLRATSAESGWRIVIVDSVDEMNANSANAILKILEEPGKKTVLMMITHASGSILPTIKSRCLELKLKPLEKEDVVKSLQDNFINLDEENLEFVIELAAGSPGIAADLYKNNAREIYVELIDFLTGKIPASEFLETIARKEDAEKFSTVSYLTLALVSRCGKAKINRAAIDLFPEEAEFLGFIRKSGADETANAYAKIQKILNEVSFLNMDKRSAFISINNIVKLAA